MVAISDIFGYFQMHFRERKYRISIKISLKFIPEGPIYNMPAMI